MVAKWKFYIIRGCFFAASRRLPLERIFYPDSGGSHNFDTSGVKVFSREGWLWPLWNSEYVKATSNPVGGTSGPLDPKLNQKFVPTGHKVKIFPFGCLVLTFPDAYQLGSKTKSFGTGLNFAPSKFGIFEGENFSQGNPKKQASSMPTTWEVLLTCTLTTEEPLPT